jgi:hypothetical protein
MLRGVDAPLVAGKELEATALAALFGTVDERERMRAFLEKRLSIFVRQ